MGPKPSPSRMKFVAFRINVRTFEVTPEHGRLFVLLVYEWSWYWHSSSSWVLFLLLQWQLRVREMEVEMEEISEAADLFEVSLPDFRQLKACRREIVLLKILWDMVVLVRTSFQEWTKTLWREINVEQLDMDCKKFVKDIRLLDKEMRSWDAFLGLESSVKNMVTSLRAVGELQNPAIRDRHWQQLMQATKVSLLC